MRKALSNQLRLGSKGTGSPNLADTAQEKAHWRKETSFGRHYTREDTFGEKPQVLPETVQNYLLEKIHKFNQV